MISKVWCFSDTHGKHAGLKVPDGIDLAIFAGDAGTMRDPYNNEQVVKDMLEWYASLHIPYKVFIGGNHDTSLEKGLITRADIERKGIIYLDHESKEVDNLHIFGSPYTPRFGEGWAYNVKRDKLDAYWAEIPALTDIVVTHGPPLGILDHTQCGTSINTDPTWGNTCLYSCGDKSLLNHIRRVNPQLHVFGHIHNEDRCPNASIMRIQGNRTLFANASCLDLDYNVCNNGHTITL